MTNFEYYIKSGRTEESWEEAWAEFLKFNESASDKERTGRAIDRYNRWLLAEHEESILDDVEREYLSNVIKPFRDKIICISKFDNGDYCRISIRLYNNGADHLFLPKFDRSAKMYVNMKSNRRYTLKELNL